MGKPWGETRYNGSTTATDRRFTSQRSEEATLGSLYEFGARFYSPVLGRFLSADTLVPSPANPQAFNRYAYGLNNPVKYTDPSGHYVYEDDPTEGLIYDSSRVKKVYGTDVRLRESDSSWTRDAGHQPTDVELAGTFLSVPVIALVGAATEVVGGVADGLATLGARATVACYYSTLCAGLIGLGGAAGAEAARGAIDESVEGASSGAEAVILEKSLASAQQMSGPGIPIAGAGTEKVFRDVPRIVSQYGGTITDWAKMVSRSFTASDGVKFETHWVENVVTGLRVEFKTIIDSFRRAANR